MRLATAPFVNPAANTLYVAFAVAVSLFVFAYSVQFGKAAVLALYAVWFLPVLMCRRLLLWRPGPALALFGLAGLAALSTLWSMNPAATLRAAIQYGSTILCALVAARIAGLRGLLLGGLVGSALVLGYSLAVGRSDYDVVDGSFRFVGAFASKNQLGLFATLATVFAAGTMLFRDGRGLRLPAVAVGALGMVLLYRSASATAMMTMAATLGLVVVLRAAARLAPTPRFVGVLLGGAIAVALGVGALQAGAFESVLGAFGKDATLTGRTFLWAEGFRAFAERPVLGFGYQAFWTVGYPPAELLWEEFFITARTGFHFHNTFIEAAVGLGAVGLVAVAGLLAALLALSARALMRPAIAADAILPIGLGLLMLMRAFVEIDFLTPYTVGTFLLYFALARLEMPVRRAVAAAVPQPA